MLKLHPRLLVTQQASIDIGSAILKVVEKHELTPIEVSRILTLEIQNYLKYALRAERHPGDPEKKADEA